MICRMGVQDRLKIRLDALVELPFKKFRFVVTPCAVLRVTSHAAYGDGHGKPRFGRPAYFLGTVVGAYFRTKSCPPKWACQQR
jgi:hypothetical protein